jgi:hypothetical protein
MDEALLCTLKPRVGVSFPGSVVDDPRVHGALSGFAPCDKHSRALAQMFRSGKP